MWICNFMDGRKISKNKGGLFNRQTCRLYLEPFNLHEVEEFLTSRDIYWSRFEITECYMIMGGIPYYLNLMDPEESLHQNIDRLFFKKKENFGMSLNTYIIHCFLIANTI